MEIVRIFMGEVRKREKIWVFIEIFVVGIF